MKKTKKVRIQNEVIDPDLSLSKGQRTSLLGYLRTFYPKIKYRAEVSIDGEFLHIRCVPQKWPGKPFVFRWPKLTH